jgi:hypothetical protein
MSVACFLLTRAQTWDPSAFERIRRDARLVTQPAKAGPIETGLQIGFRFLINISRSIVLSFISQLDIAQIPCLKRLSVLKLGL